jgi:CBS domain-containing protein
MAEGSEHKPLALALLEASDALAILRRLEQGDAAPGGYAQAAREAVRYLREAGVEAPQIGEAVAELNDALARLLLRRAEAELGPPPRACAFLVYGSDGRREQLLPTDQDNALVWAGGEGGEEAAKGYFEALADRMVEELQVAGFPPCPGGYMATRWRFPLAEAEELFAGWLERPRPEQVVDICSFFDFRVAAGELDPKPLQEIRRRAAGAKRLLRLLAADAAEMRLPLGWLGGLREGEEGFDLKRGILLIVSLARIFALEAGSTEVGTLRRLRDAEGTLGKSDAETLAEAFRFLVGLRLDEQLGGHAHGSRVELAELNAMEISFLEDVFHFLQRLKAALPQRFAL